MLEAYVETNLYFDLGSFHSFTHAFLQRVGKRTGQTFRGGRIVTAQNKGLMRIARATQSCGLDR